MPKGPTHVAHLFENKLGVIEAASDGIRIVTALIVFSLVIFHHLFTVLVLEYQIRGYLRSLIRGWILGDALGWSPQSAFRRSSEIMMLGLFEHFWWGNPGFNQIFLWHHEFRSGWLVHFFADDRLLFFFTDVSLNFLRYQWLLFDFFNLLLVLFLNVEGWILLQIWKSVFLKLLQFWSSFLLQLWEHAFIPVKLGHLLDVFLYLGIFQLTVADSLLVSLKNLGDIFKQVCIFKKICRSLELPWELDVLAEIFAQF